MMGFIGLADRIHKGNRQGDGGMQERDVLLGLHGMAGIGWQTIARLKDTVDDLRELTRMGERELALVPLPADRRGREIGSEKRGKIFDATRDGWISRQKERLAHCGADFVTLADDRYPEWLRHIYRPPWVLYGIGQWSLLEQPVIAVVGTRLPTIYGKRTARRLAAELSEAGWHVASGLARGIDSEAHEGALSGPGKTIAVLATPVDTPYPRELASLYRRICGEGLALSETPPGTRLTKGLFPLRNRIISGISLGTVVVEADRQSGSLITAACAQEQNRELFAVPGPVSSPKSAGTNQLIQKSHAKLVMEAADIFEEFPGWKRVNETDIRREKGTVPQAGDEVGEDGLRVLELLGDVPVSFDELLEATEFDFGHLHSVLLHLLMIKKIEQEPGSSFIRNY